MAEVIYAGDAGVFKTCTKCGQTLATSFFAKASTGELGLRGDCKDCRSAVYRSWYVENAPMAIAATEAYRAQHLEETKAAKKRWYRANLDRERDKRRDWRLKHPEAQKEWRASNPVRNAELAARSNAKKLATPQGRLEHGIKAQVHRGLKLGSKAGRKTFALLGYSVDELAAHLESLFQDGMTWDNHSKTGWHIDHIIPLSAFNYETPDHSDFRRAWALSNLRPLWAKENLRKNCRLEEPFQPSLAI